MSAWLLPLKAYRPPRCLAPPRIFPKGTSDVSRLCSPCRRMPGTISNLRRFCLYRSSARVVSSDAALFKMTLRCVIGKHIFDTLVAGKAAR